MSRVTTAHHNSDHSTPGAGTAIPSIPLSAADSVRAEEQSIGGLIRDATTHLSTLVRAEVELARAEVTAEIKKGLKGSVFFLVALTVLLFSLFFFFFTIAELLAQFGLYRWAAFGIVFLAMLAAAGASAFLGWLKVRRIRPPERTISTVKETATALAKRGEHPQIDA